MENDPLIKDDQSIILNVKDKGHNYNGYAHTYWNNNIIQYAKELSGERMDIEYICCIMKNMHPTCGIFELLIPRTISMNLKD